MIQKNFYKAVSLSLICSLAMNLSGCVKKSTDTSDTKRNPVSDTASKGRYLEQDFELPELDTDTSLCGMTEGENNLPLIYTMTTKDKKLNVTTYQYAADGTKQKANPEWLQGIDIDSSLNQSIYYKQASDGAQYLLLNESSHSLGHSTLYKSTDGKTRTIIPMQDWDEQSDDGTYRNYAFGFVVLANGTIVARTLEGIYAYDQDGKLTASIDESQDCGNIYAKENTLLCTIQDGGAETYKGNVLYDGNDFKKEPEKKMLKDTQDLTEAVNINDHGDLIYVNSTGICIQKKGTDIWQTVMDGSLGTMYIPQVVGSYVIEDSDENFYVSYYDYSGDGYRLIKYYYDPDVNTTPSQELSLYSLEMTNTLRKCISEFQKKNPDVRVNLQVAMPLEEEEDANKTTPKHDYIQSLNTELLAGQGCDIINVSQLPYESYAQKGVLLDLSKDLEPIKDQLLTNLVDACQINGKQYAVPLRYSVSMIYAPKEDVASLATIDNIMKYVQSHSDSNLFGNFLFDDYLLKFLPFGIPKILPDHKSVDAKQLTSYLEVLKTIADGTGIKDSYEDDFDYHYSGYLGETGGIVIDNVNSIESFTLDSSYIEAFDYDYTSVENSFTPTVELAVNASSKKAELAKEFILFCLNEKIQECSMEDGFPVQKEALEKTAMNVDWDTIDAYDADGNRHEYPLVKIEGKRRQRLVDTIKSLNQLAVSDDAVTTIMKDHLPDFFDGKKSLEEATSEIQNKLELYIKE